MRRIVQHRGLGGLFFRYLLLSIYSIPAYADVLEDYAALWQSVYAQGLTIAEGITPTLPMEVLAKAAPDECFSGIYVPASENPDALPENPNVYDPEQKASCDHNKVNQSYIWGLAKSGNNIWFGTGPNVNCLVSASYLDVSTEEQNDAWACEFEYSQYLKELLNELPDLIAQGFNPDQIQLKLFGDWRPPRIFVYNVLTKVLTEKTPAYSVLFPYPETLVNGTIGIRSAGAVGETVFLAGPSAFSGIDIYAFNANTGTYIGSTNLNALPGENIASVNNIRKWLVVDGILYTTVGVTYDDGVTEGGKVLRWRGGTLLNPFDFEVVGTLDSAGAELAVHEGRLFVSTWPGGGEIGLPSSERNQAPAGLYMSPVIPAGGLTHEHAAEGIWQKVWSVSDYEPDPVIAAAYGGGALASFDGYLFWGTMHVPYLNYFAQYRHILRTAGRWRNVYFPDAGQWDQFYPAPTTEYIDRRNLLILRSTIRAVSIFRGKNFGRPDQKTDLVYGLKALPRFTLSGNAESGWIGTYDLADNNMEGAQPLLGPSGFGNIYNNYTWTMSVYSNRLYVGTMNSAILTFRGEIPSDPYLAPTMGANLFYFTSADAPALPESLDGIGNYANYGIRTMASDDALYLGTANPMNILTDDDGKNIGGWELIKLGSWTTSAVGTGKISIEIEDNESGQMVIDHIAASRDDDPDVNQTGKPTDLRFPDGMVSFSVKNLEHPGDDVYVRITFPGDYPDDAKYFKVTENGFEEFVNPDGSPRYVFNGNSVVLQLTDGDHWDKDGLANGEISDPGGPAMAASTSDSGGGGCFIGTLPVR